MKKKKKTGLKIGFVPTMGALHHGHLSLVQCSKKENDITVVSIFVNPTQFNNPDDLKLYPRKEKKDLDMLENENCDIVFIPEVSEMYPKNTHRVFELGGLDKVMEGEFRPGHFQGVAEIVSKLFETVKPDNAYFGKKDFQQAAVIKYLAKNYFAETNINIVVCDIVREPDGLAMSSRNVRLTKEQRKAAVLISQTLFKYLKTDTELGINEIKERVIDTINKNQYLQTEYFDIVNNETLQTAKDGELTKGLTGCIAVYAGKVRLIDNVSVTDSKMSQRF